VFLKCFMRMLCKCSCWLIIEVNPQVVFDFTVAIYMIVCGTTGIAHLTVALLFDNLVHNINIWSRIIHVCVHVSDPANGTKKINPLKAELNFICHLLALLAAHHILRVSRIRVQH